MWKFNQNWVSFSTLKAKVIHLKQLLLLLKSLKKLHKFIYTKFWFDIELSFI